MAEKKEYARGGNKGIYVTKKGYLVDRTRANELNNKYKKEHYKTISLRIKIDETEVIKKLESVKSKSTYIINLIKNDIEG